MKFDFTLKTEESVDLTCVSRDKRWVAANILSPETSSLACAPPVSDAAEIRARREL